MAKYLYQHVFLLVLSFISISCDKTSTSITSSPTPPGNIDTTENIDTTKNITTPSYTDTVKLVSTPTISGEHIWFDRKYKTTRTPLAYRIDSTIADSQFTCQLSNCFWHYTYKYDTTNTERFYYTYIDSVRCIDTFTFSFFNKTNSPCSVGLSLWNNGKSIPIEILSSQKVFTPGYNHKIFYTFKNTVYYSYSLPYDRIIKIKPLNDSIMPMVDTIRYSGLTNTFTPIDSIKITDSLLLASLQGSWKLVLEQNADNFDSFPLVDYSNKNKGILIRNKEIFEYDTTWVSDSSYLKLAIRTGYSFSANSTQTPYPYSRSGGSYFVELIGDTLISYSDRYASYHHSYKTGVYVKKE